jgi:hypothetical protein
MEEFLALSRQIMNLRGVGGDYEIARRDEHGFEIYGVFPDDGADVYGIRICCGLLRYCCAIEV